MPKKLRKKQRGGASLNDLPPELITKVSSHGNLTPEDVRNLHSVDASRRSFFQNNRCYVYNENLKSKGSNLNILDFCKKLSDKDADIFINELSKAYETKKWDMEKIISNDYFPVLEYILKFPFQATLIFKYTEVPNYTSANQKMDTAFNLTQSLLRNYSKLGSKIYKYLDLVNSMINFKTLDESMQSVILVTSVVGTKGDLSIFKYFIDKGMLVSISVVNSISGKNPSGIDYLYKKGKNLNQYFSDYRFLSFYFNNVYKLEAENLTKSLEIFLKNGADPNRGALVLATKNNLVKPVELLLKYGGDPTRSDTTHELRLSAISYAMNNKNLEILKIFQKRGKKSTDQDPGSWEILNERIDYIEKTTDTRSSRSSSRISTLKNVGLGAAALTGAAALGFGLYKSAKLYSKIRKSKLKKSKTSTKAKKSTKRSTKSTKVKK